MEVLTIPVGPLGANSYVLSNGDEAIIIDAGDECEKILSILASKNLKPIAVLLTHGHFDHCGGAKFFQDKNIPIYLHEDDIKLINGDGHLASFCGLDFARFNPDFKIKDGDEIAFADKTIKVIHTPGHTDGSVCYLIDELVFSGDTLFYLSIGRTDFPSGNTSKMRLSLQKLFTMDENLTVYPGHGERTTIGFEKKNNPYA